MVTATASPPVPPSSPCLPAHSSALRTDCVLSQQDSTYPPSPSSNGNDETWCLPCIKLVDIIPEEGAATPVYFKEIEQLSSCLSKYGAVGLQLSAEDSALVRCTLESIKLYFSTRTKRIRDQVDEPVITEKYSGYASSASEELYYYRAGRDLSIGGTEHPPVCMSDLFRCFGKASRVALTAISRHLRLRGEAFYPLLDDCPLPDESVSSSVLVAAKFRNVTHSNAVELNGGKANGLQEFEKGLLTLIASESPGIHICDSNGRWQPADVGLQIGDLLLISGKALQHISAGYFGAFFYRIPRDSACTGRTFLTFRLMPRGDAILDASAMVNAGHAVSEGYKPVLAGKFLGYSSDSPATYHSLGQRCSVCGSAIQIDQSMPNLALKAASTYKLDEKRRRIKIASRKRRKEFVFLDDRIKRLKGIALAAPTKFKRSRRRTKDGKGLPYPFRVDERVLIKGNKRTPEKLVGREAVVTSQCLNGWYLVRLLDNGESVRLQRRSLQKSKIWRNGDGVDSTQPENEN